MATRSEDDYGQDDRDYWNNKYAEASCHTHGEDSMHYDDLEAEWVCLDCEEGLELTRIYNYG